MKYALISPNEIRETGYRIADVADTPFEVALPLFWVECDDGMFIDAGWYDPANQTIVLFPEEPEQPSFEVVQPISDGAQTL